MLDTENCVIKLTVSVQQYRWRMSIEACMPLPESEQVYTDMILYDITQAYVIDLYSVL